MAWKDLHTESEETPQQGQDARSHTFLDNFRECGRGKKMVLLLREAASTAAGTRRRWVSYSGYFSEE